MAQQYPGRKPHDFTGRQRDELAQRHAAELKARQGQIAMANAVMVEEAETTIPEVKLVDDGGVTMVEETMVTIRLNTTLEKMTYGAGNHFTFEEGRQYRVPAHMAQYLESQGFVWH